MFGWFIIIKLAVYIADHARIHRSIEQTYIDSGVFVFGFLVLKASCGASRRSVSVICYALSERSAETKHRTGQALDGCETVRAAFKDGYPPHQPTLIKCARRRIYVKHLFPSVCWAIVYTVPMLIH